MDTTPSTPVVTCRDAAVAFRRAAEEAVYEHEDHRLSGAADLLEAMGDMPFPTQVVEQYPGVFRRGSM